LVTPPSEEFVEDRELFVMELQEEPSTDEVSPSPPNDLSDFESIDWKAFPELRRVLKKLADFFSIN
jgi:hypothetical protein